MKEGGVELQELLFSHNGITLCSGLSKWFDDRKDKDGTEVFHNHLSSRLNSI